MGGTRCCFRQCPVATERNKGMHFFKFPIKERQRFERWCELAGVQYLLKRETSEVCNKVICARHFPYIGFMNYKNNRLTRLAMPTLHRLSEEIALDFSNDPDNPVLIQLPPITSPHLIPPEGFPDPMHFVAADRKLAEQVVKSLEQNTMPEVAKPITPSLKRSHSISIKFQEIKKEKLSGNTPIIRSCVVLSNGSKNSLEEESTANEIEMQTDSIDLFRTHNADGLPKEPSTEKTAQSKERFGNNESLNAAIYEANNLIEEDEVSTKSDWLENVAKELLSFEETGSQVNSSKIEELTETNVNLKLQLDKTVKERTELNNELASLKIKYNMLQQSHSDQQKNFAELKSQQAEEQKKLSQAQSRTQQQFTKGQLFNSIKKYLSQTMIALLRIQLASGSVEREWKPDERRLAIDLMGLGEDVYKYFSDEWLIRLPPLKEVQYWLTENEVVDEDDDI